MRGKTVIFVRRLTQIFADGEGAGLTKENEEGRAHSKPPGTAETDGPQMTHESSGKGAKLLLLLCVTRSGIGCRQQTKTAALRMLNAPQARHETSLSETAILYSH
jgi:hypothetical protein